jgi:hypothetical protein
MKSKNAEVIPAAPPADAPVTGKRKGVGLNRKQESEVTKAEQILRNALKPEYRGELEARLITLEFLAGLRGKIDACRALAAGGLGSRADYQSLVRATRAAKEILMEKLREIQAAAKQKFARKARVKLKDYFIGMEIDANEPILWAVAFGILAVAQDDALPGLTPEMIAEAKAASATWERARFERDSSKWSSVGNTELRAHAVKEITDRRMEIQFAAESTWPSGRAGNEAARVQFYLPPSRPYTG